MHRLRRLTEEDAGEFWQFRLAALERSPESFAESADELRSTTVADTALLFRASSEDNFVLGAFVDDRLAATVGFFRNRGAKTRHKGRVWGLFVEETLRRRGIARSLLDDLLTRIRHIDGLRQVSLSVATTASAAIALYDALGFSSFGVERRALWIDDHYVDEQHRVLMLDVPAQAGSFPRVS